MRVEKFNSETFAKRDRGLDREGIHSYLVSREEVLTVPTLRAGIGTGEISQFSADSRPISSKFSGNFDFNSFKRIHDSDSKLDRGIVDSHISWPICPCNFARIIRLKDMGISSLEWSTLWERI